MTHTIVAITWKSSSDLDNEHRNHYQLVKTETENLRSTMTALFHNRKDINQCLVKADGKMYVCERKDGDVPTYYKIPVDYHPLMYLLE